MNLYLRSAIMECQRTTVDNLPPPPIFMEPFTSPHLFQPTQFFLHAQHPTLIGPDPYALLPLKAPPKPTHSYIGLIAKAILSSPSRKLLLNDIYQWITGNYVYFRTRGSGWKNSIRHNLSLNDCFVKAGRCPNGKGHYWSIHPANLDDFMNGDFRRRRAQLKVKKHQNLLSVDRGNESSSDDDNELQMSPVNDCCKSLLGECLINHVTPPGNNDSLGEVVKLPKKRGFNIDSLLSNS